MPLEVNAGCISPEPLKAVERSFGLSKDMYDHIAVVKEDPIPKLVPFYVNRLPGILLDGFVSESLNVPLART